MPPLDMQDDLHFESYRQQSPGTIHSHLKPGTYSSPPDLNFLGRDSTFQCPEMRLQFSGPLLCRLMIKSAVTGSAAAFVKPTSIMLKVGVSPRHDVSW